MLRIGSRLQVNRRQPTVADRSEADAAGVAAQGVPADRSGSPGPGREIRDRVANSGAIETRRVDGGHEESNGVVGVGGGVVGKAAEASLEGGWESIGSFI